MYKHLAFIIALLSIFTICLGQWHIDENFDNITTLPAGWTIHDDGDGMVWRNLNNATHAHSGTRAAFCDNYLPNQNADWLITPQLNIAEGDSLIFYTRSWISTEQLKVYVSTTGTAINNFTTQLVHLQNIGTTYQRVSLNLSNWANQMIYIGFLWNCINYGILIDDVQIGQPLIIQPALNLPESFSFIQGETLTIDFTPFITCTDINSCTLSVSGNVNINVQINGRIVTFSSPDFTGSENVTFTMTDNISGLSASDTVVVEVLPVPTLDLGIIEIPSPREFEYQNHSFIPALKVQNLGTASYSGMLSISCNILNSSGTSIYSNEEFHPLDLQPGNSATVTLSTSCVITSEGTYNAIFSLISEDGNPTNNTMEKSFTVVNRITQGGPDTFGYRFIDSNDEAGPEFNWIDISSTGTSTIMYQVPSWAGDDNFSEAIPMGFPFPFYGQLYDNMYVDINGEILLSESNWQKPYPNTGWDSDGNMFNYVYPIPGYNAMPTLIAVYWDDLFAEQGISDIYFQTFGEAPNRYTVVQWNNLRFLAGTGGTPQLKFEVIFYENGDILMQYHTTHTGQSGSNIPHQNGQSATVAIQNQDATIGLCYLREIVINNQYQGVEPPGNLLHDNLAIKFFTGIDEQPPHLTYNAAGNTFNRTPLLKVNAIDLSPITSLALHYNTGEGWQSMEYTSQSGTLYYFQLPELPQGVELNYYFTATDSEDNTGSLPEDAPTHFYSFKILPTADTEVLIAYSGRQDYQRIELPVYTNLLDNLNISYDIYNWEEYDSFRFPLQYKAILCYANVGSHTAISDTLSLALMQYLDSGTTTEPKNVFFASDGFAGSTHANPNTSLIKKLFNAYFRSYYVPTGSGGGTNGLAGPEVFSYQYGSILCYTYSPIGIVGNEYQVYADSPDCIFRYDSCPDWYAAEVQYPEIGAQSAFLFEDGPIDGHAYLYHGVCATTVTLPIYKAFYFSFDFSQVYQEAQRYELMSDLMQWFGISPDANEDYNIPQVETKINGNYPNPFNPETTISFTLAKNAKVKLDIYNVRGQKIKTLLNDNLSAGIHNCIWDGKDDNGQIVSSAMYIVRLDDGNKIKQHKMMLIK